MNMVGSGAAWDLEYSGELGIWTEIEALRTLRTTGGAQRVKLLLFYGFTDRIWIENWAMKKGTAPDYEDYPRLYLTIP